MDAYFKYRLLCFICYISYWQIYVSGSPVNGQIHLYINGSEVTPSPGSTETPPFNGVRCTTDKECSINQCCVHNPLSRPQTKRFIFEEFTQHDHGYCREERQLNQTCFPLGHDFLNPELYEFHCPCVTGLECRGLTVHETQHTIHHVNPRCQHIES